MGEAVKHLDEQTRLEAPEIEWRKIAGLRDMLAHAHFGVDADVIWDVTQTKIPELAAAVRKILAGITRA